MIDSRLVRPGNMFVAIKGKTSDGHRFISQAIDRGARAIVINGSFYKKNIFKKGIKYIDNIPIVVVQDTIQALGEISKIYRETFTIPVLAIAGSNGKTTTKDMITKVLSSKYDVMSTEENFNNHIGVPLTLFRLDKGHEIAVVEIGTNHFGEIKYLCEILQPTHGIITNIGNEHLEYLRNKEGVLKEEGALFEYLSTRNNKKHAFVNSDDAGVLKISRKMKNKTFYGIENGKSDYSAEIINSDISGNHSFKIKYEKNKKSEKINLSVPGKHNVYNALCTAAVGMYFNVPFLKIKKALESFRATDKRMEVVYRNGVMILNDSYNANLDSSIAALETLDKVSNKGKKIIIFGDMLELGKHSINHHSILGQKISELSKKKEHEIHLLTIGKYAKYVYREAKIEHKRHFQKKAELTKELLKILTRKDVILIKGSRGMKMEEIIEKIK